MFKFHLSRFILLLMLMSSGWVQANTSFSQVFVFGDSLSDTGNLASVLGDLPSPHYMNRISNGPIAVELLAAQFGRTAEASLHLVSPEVGTNYAVASANAAGFEPIDLSTQIISFQANHVIAPASALYVIFIGGNDIRDARDEPSLFLARSKIKAAAAKVKNAVESLSRIGARSFLLINAPNVSLMPETRLLATTTNNPWLVRRTHQLSELYQSELRKTAFYLENIKGLDITEFDLFRFFNDLVENADEYGFSNTTDACFSPDDSTFHPDCNFDQFIFFDDIHPTARVHSLVNKALYEALDSAGQITWFSWYLTNFKSLVYSSFMGQ